MTEGGIYSIDNGDGKFGVVKILKLEPGVVHVRVYKNKFAARPTSVQLDELSLGSVKDKDGWRSQISIATGRWDFLEENFGWGPKAEARAGAVV